MLNSRIKAIIAVFFVVAIMGFNAPSKAERVQNLYTGAWPVQDQSSAARHQAIAESLLQALVRASGSRDVSRSPVIQSALANAEDYLRRYSYQRLSAAEQMIYEKPLLLKATFDRRSILELLKSASLPIWGEERPSGLFWIAYGDDTKRQVASEESQFIKAGLMIAAESRGLPVTLPMMDIDDQMALETSDVWGRVESPIDEASKRYARDYWVAGQLLETNSQWQGRWLVRMNGRTESFSTSGLTSYEAIQAAVHRVANSLASKLAVVLSEDAQEVLVSVENITDFATFARIQKHLNSLSMVRSASAIEVSKDTVLFKVESLTSPQNLIEAIKIGNNLQRSESGFGYDDRYGDGYGEGFDENNARKLRGDFHFVWGTP
jgi:hypothetical protein